MSEMNEFLTLDLPELRRRLEDHKATRPADHFGKEMQTWMTTKGRITFAIELKEAEERQQPFHITVPPQPIERPVQPLLRLRRAKPSTQEVRHADSPGHAGAPGAPIPEAPMPKATPARGRHHDPQGRIQHLVAVLRAAAEKKEKCYWAQQEIREICAFYKLDVPPEAQKTRPVAQAAPSAAPAAPVLVAPRQPERQVVVEGPMGDTGIDLLLRGPMSAKGAEILMDELLGHFVILHKRGLTPSEWHRIVQDLGQIETTCAGLRQIAARRAEAS